jgi:hypothetical protein
LYWSAAANNQLATDQYNLNSANLKPYSDRGNVAGGYVSDLLGIGGDPAKAAAGFQNYQNSTGYQYQLQQGLGAVNSNAYAKGMGDSGATLKALQDRGNNIAAGSFNNYLGQLTNVQNTGMSAGSSLAGVGSNYVNQTSANNNNAAAAAGNAALSNASNINGSIQNLIGAGAYAYGSSYGGGKNAYGISGSGNIY